ncbi:MAG: LPS export ABC transporter ATP-binding protein [Candidatus Bipolaricaulota bacterium]
MHNSSRLIEGRGLVRSFGRYRAVDGLDLMFHAGEAIGLLGPNGAGKTTTFHLLTGFLQPDAGEVLLDGEPVTHLPFYERARRGIHYLPQEPSVFLRTTVRGNLCLALDGMGARWDEKVDEVLEELGLQGFQRRRVGRLSAGERRKVEIARALVTQPSFLLLDEPFSGVDPITVAELSSTLRRLTEEGIGVAICDHNVRDTLQLTDRAYLIHHGKLLMYGTSEEIVEDPSVRLAYLGEGFRL